MHSIDVPVGILATNALPTLECGFLNVPVFDPLSKSIGEETNSGCFGQEVRSVSSLTMYSYIVARRTSNVRNWLGGNATDFAPTCFRKTLTAAVPKTTAYVTDIYLAESLKAQRHDIEALDDDWDGYGASKLPKAAISRFFDEIAALLANFSGPAPTIVPGADGSIQAEWHRNALQVFYALDEDGERHLFLKFGKSPSQTYSGPDAKTEFLQVLKLLRGGYFGETNISTREISL